MQRRRICGKNTKKIKNLSTTPDWVSTKIDLMYSCVAKSCIHSWIYCVQRRPAFLSVLFWCLEGMATCGRILFASCFAQGPGSWIRTFSILQANARVTLFRVSQSLHHPKADLLYEYPHMILVVASSCRSPYVLVCFETCNKFNSFHWMIQNVQCAKLQKLSVISSLWTQYSFHELYLRNLAKWWKRSKTMQNTTAIESC